MKNQVAIVILSVFVSLFAACSGGPSKKVVIMASGNFKIDDKTITLQPGLTHNEQEIVYPEEKVTLTVKTPDGATKTFDVTGSGVFLLNLQADTLIGGLVNYGTSTTRSNVTAEYVDKIIDSTQQLMLGKNESAESKTYFLPPFTLKNISAQSNARLISSFKGIPYKVEADAEGKIPEVYKFFTNKQKRETLNELFEQREKMKKEGLRVVE